LSAIHGKGASVKNGANTVAEIDEWSLDLDRDVPEKTAFSAGSLPWKTFAAGLVGATAKFSGRLDMTDTNGQYALFNNLTSDTPLTMSLYLDATHNFGFSCLVKKFGGKASVSDLESVDWDIQITGAVTYS